jgi:hypothetical protein
MLEGQHYQNAYITRDIEKAVAGFRARSAVEKVMRFEGPVEVTTPNGRGTAVSKLAFIWINNLQYELIQPVNSLNMSFGSLMTLWPSPTREVAKPYMTSKGPPLYVGRDLMKSSFAGMSCGFVRKGNHPEV